MTTTIVERPPWKKALLIGINYRGSSSELRGPHDDVAAMKELLIGSYGYQPKDIVVLIDKDEPGRRQPTRKNMMDSMKELVADARKGDRFFFHFAGHTMQEINRKGTEEDGFDECLKTVEEELIKDDDLRDFLVDPLPVGSSLVAVIDACHSGTSLDLPHFRCNRIPGYGLGPPLGGSGTHFPSRVLDDNALSGHRQNPPYEVSRPMTSININITSSTPSLDQVFEDGSKEYAHQKQALLVNSDLGGSSASLESSVLCISPICISPICISPICISPICISPIHFPAACECTGFCNVPPQKGTAHVISLSACKDSQLSWENSSGESMTRILVEALQSAQHPSLRDLMTSVLRGLSEGVKRRRAEVQIYKEKHKERNKKRALQGKPPKKLRRTVEQMDFHQDAQLSSLETLDMDSKWDP